MCAEREDKADMTEQLENQLLESVAIKHLQPRQHGEWHGAVLRLRLCQLSQQLLPPKAGSIWEEQIICLQLLLMAPPWPSGVAGLAGRPLGWIWTMGNSAELSVSGQGLSL